MKLLLLTAIIGTGIIGMAFSAPPQMYMEFDIHHAPPELLPVNGQRQYVGGPVQGFIKQEIPGVNGKDEEIYYPFGFNLPGPAAAAPIAPAAPVAPGDPVAPGVPVAPASPVNPVVIIAAPVAKLSDDDEEDD